MRQIALFPVFAALLYCGIGATAAYASCGSRPGTPDRVEAHATSATSIGVSWRNTTGKHALLGLEWEFKPGLEIPIPHSEHIMYFDMYFRDATKRPINRDLTGRGSFRVSYGSRTAYQFGTLNPNTKYCFALRARTEAGTNGCISARNSNWACATTLRR